MLQHGTLFLHLFGAMITSNQCNVRPLLQVAGADPAKNFMGAENVDRKTTPFSGHAFKPKQKMINALITLKLPLFISKDENTTF